MIDRDGSGERDAGATGIDRDAVRVLVVLEYRRGVHPLPDDGAWRVVEVIPDAPPDGAPPATADAGRRHVWDGLSLCLDPAASDDYYHNLRSQSPGVFVVCRPCGDGALQPRRVTTSFHEASGEADAAEQVCRVPMHGGIRRWLERRLLRRFRTVTGSRYGPEGDA